MKFHREHAEPITASARPATDADRTPPKPGLTPPQFRLSTLLAVTAIVCVGLALAKIVSPALSGLAVMILCVVFAHVAGNAVGTQLRSSSRHAQPLEGNCSPARGRPTDENVFAPATRLSHRTRLGWGTVVITAMASIAGATGGGWLLWWSMNGEASIPSMILGGISCGVLGGFWGFGTSSLLGVLGGAVRHAHQDPNKR
jgi:hypothetical protein